MRAKFDRAPQPYNQFSFRGHSNTNAGAFVNFNRNNFSFFTEYATSLGDGNAVVAGGLVSLTKKMELSVLYRNYGRNFHPFYNNALSENTASQNEKGFYWGWKYKFTRRYALSGYMDIFEFPWLKFRTYAPSRGLETLLRFTWQPTRTTVVFIQGRMETKARNDSEETVTYHLNETTKYNYWISFDYAVHPALRMKTRVQGSQFIAGSQKSRGILILQDVIVSLNKFKFSARYALFDTDDFDNRQYAYENDVFMSYSLPAYYGVGTRRYCVVQYKMNRMFTFWLRYSHTRYLHAETSGSGPEEIEGNKRNEIKFVARIKF
jgi:hypothetical protein